MDGYDTNLAAEFHVLSALHRLGLTATLTLGNKKAVDIVVVRGRGEAVTVDVKGLAGTTSWPVDKVDPAGRPGHYLAFVGYGGKIADPRVLPEVYIVPSPELAPLTYVSPKGRRVVPVGRLRKRARRYRDAWHFLTGVAGEAPADDSEAEAAVTPPGPDWPGGELDGPAGGEGAPEGVDWPRVLRFRAALRDRAFTPGEWRTPDGALPYHDPSEVTRGLVEALYSSGVVDRTFVWPEWQAEAERLRQDPAALGAADLADLRRLLTTHVRADRFTEGHLASVLKSGHILAVLDRAAALVRAPEHPGTWVTE